MNPIIKKHYTTVIQKNTFYFNNATFQEQYENHINSLKESLLFLQHQIKKQGLDKNIFEKLLENKENGLDYTASKGRKSRCGN